MKTSKTLIEENLGELGFGYAKIYKELLKLNNNPKLKTTT